MKVGRRIVPASREVPTLPDTSAARNTLGGEEMRSAILISLALVLPGCHSSPSVDFGALTISELNDNLTDPDPNVRWSTVFELGRRDAEAAPAIPNLIKCLKGEDVRVRRVTTQTLGGILMSTVPPYPTDVKDAISALRKAQSDSDETVRAGAEISLFAVDAKSRR